MVMITSHFRACHICACLVCHTPTSQSGCRKCRIRSRARVRGRVAVRSANERSVAARHQQLPAAQDAESAASHAFRRAERGRLQHHDAASVDAYSAGDVRTGAELRGE